MFEIGKYVPCSISVTDVRIYFLLGEPDNHLGLLEALNFKGLLDNEKEDEYFVVGIRNDAWDAKGPRRRKVGNRRTN